MPQNNSIAVLRLESGPSRASQYMDHIMIDVATQEVLDPLKVRYTDLGAAQSFIDTIAIERTGFLKFDLVIDHDIAQWLEYGTEPHKIEADEAEFLHFQFRKTSSWFASHAGDSGDWIKKFKIDHPGFPGYQLIAILLQTLVQNYKAEIVRRTNEWLQRSRIQ